MMGHSIADIIGLYEAVITSPKWVAGAVQAIVLVRVRYFAALTFRTGVQLLKDLWIAAPIPLIGA